MGGAVRASGARRVVVTGVGCVSPLGPDLARTWSALLAGASGVGPFVPDDGVELPVRIAARVGEPVDVPGLGHKERRRMDRTVLLALAAAGEAMTDADLAAGRFDPERAGTAIGSAIGGLETLLHNHRVYLESGPRRVSPFLVPMTLVNMPGACVAIRHGLRGPSLCHASACATGALALGEAARAIAFGEVDVVVAGASEAALTGLVLAGFASMHALSTRNDEPERASRPFDLDRDGFVAGEGAGVVVLEALDHAERRGARVRAELLGYGASSDAAHVAAPAEDGRGAEQCMRRALASAGVAPGEIGYVNAHATGTPLGDRVEARALAAVLGAAVGHVPVSSTKGAMGHLLGAAGAVEAILCVRALETGMLPPTLNLDRPDPETPLEHVAWKCRQASPRVALSNSFGFGGTNVSLVLGRWED